MSDGELPDPQHLLKLARKTMSSAERRKKYRRLDFMDLSFWYPTQIKFFAAGSSGIHQRLIYGGNQTGKTECCAAEIAWHALGAYPDWWTGKRCAKPVLIWSCRKAPCSAATRCRKNSAAKLNSAPG
jgi:terminase large subunit-like protein